MTSVCSWPASLARLVIRRPLRFWPRARNRAKTRWSPSFAQQKFFASCLKGLVLGECGGDKEGEGGRPGMGVLRNEFRVAGWLTCYERKFELRTVGPNEAARLIARITRIWSHRPLTQVASLRWLERLRCELATQPGLAAQPAKFPAFHRIARERQGARHHSYSLRGRY